MSGSWRWCVFFSSSSWGWWSEAGEYDLCLSFLLLLSLSLFPSLFFIFFHHFVGGRKGLTAMLYFLLLGSQSLVLPPFNNKGECAWLSVQVTADDIHKPCILLLAFPPFPLSLCCFGMLLALPAVYWCAKILLSFQIPHPFTYGQLGNSVLSASHLLRIRFSFSLTHPFTHSLGKYKRTDWNPARVKPELAPCLGLQSASFNSIPQTHRLTVSALLQQLLSSCYDSPINRVTLIPSSTDSLSLRKRTEED